MQRVSRCFLDACGNNETSNCTSFIFRSNGHAKENFKGVPGWELWKNNSKATACFMKDGFDFGICEAAVNLTTDSVYTRYLYSLFWGFQVR